MKNLKELFISVVIVAAGKGSRMNMTANKQYIEIGGIPILARTLMVFEKCEIIDEIVVVINEKDIVFCKQHIIDSCEHSKIKTLAAGGRERQDSVYNGLLEVSGNTDIVLIHDGARPFVKEENIIESIRAAYEFGSSGIAVKVKDTIKKSDSRGFILDTVERSDLWSIQTPQVFRYDLIMQAYRKAREEGFWGTDDTMLVERMGKRIKLVEGSYDNIKITTQEDLIIAEAIINRCLRSR